MEPARPSSSRKTPVSSGITGSYNSRAIKDLARAYANVSDGLIMKSGQTW